MTLSSRDDIDPTLAHLIPSSTSTCLIDPTLLQLESVVNAARQGKFKLEEQDVGEQHVEEQQQQQHHQHHQQQHQQQQQHHLQQQQQQHQEEVNAGQDGQLEALREIVNSLTSAHQGPLGGAESGQNGVHDLHPNDTGDDLQQTYDQLALDYGIYPSSFPDASQYPTLDHVEASHAEPFDGMGETAAHASPKRGRGRPKGSRNKAKPKPVYVKRPTPDPEPRRGKGRPFKIRTPEEQELYDAKMRDKAAGIKRPRGRPRKYPTLGLVRELRLKANRTEAQEKLRELEAERRRDMEGGADDDGRGQHQSQSHADGSGGMGTDMEMEMDEHELEGDGEREERERNEDDQAEPTDDYSNWNVHDGQSLLDVVSAGMREGHDRMGMEAEYL